ncbi:uncharacterized protein LOC113003078 [Solenopsis invicta]|uniref:uncharacterized protein LOC113003078 n=1 Tax=Solenopsis invicta TaxID=13686 RepID=UPI00193EA443|nr:uncharacterized protein LOC113003078 [Solenopsis invicta]
MEENIHEQVEDNSPSIEQILRPISNTFWLLGGSIIYPPKSFKTITIITRILYTVIFLTNLISNLLHITSIYKENELIQYIYLLNELIRYVLICYNIYYGVRLYEKWPKLMDRLKELDQKLEKEIPLNNGFIQIIQLKNVIKIIPNFIAFIARPLILISSIRFLYVSDLNPIFSINIVLFFDLIMQSMINSFFFDIIVYVLYCRFQTINELIGQLDELSNVQWITFKIRRIRELHADICDLASMVNDIYSLYLLFCSASYFTMAVTTLFQVYMEIITEVYIIVLFEIVYAMQFFLVCWICTVACEESNKTGRIIHKIILNCKSVNLDKNEASNQSSLEMLSALDDLNSEQNFNSSSSHNLNYIVLENLLHKHLNQDCVRNEINDFSAQLQQNRVAFTACNFFELNNVSLSCFVGMNFTYLVIFVQLYQ